MNWSDDSIAMSQRRAGWQAALGGLGLIGAAFMDWKGPVIFHLIATACAAFNLVFGLVMVWKLRCIK